MKGHLILTGHGYADYVAAAAAMLRHCGFEADVRGVSRRRLAETLARDGAGYARVTVLGVSLSADPAGLARAAAGLKAQGVRVEWLSALEAPPAAAAALEGLMALRVKACDSILDVVAEATGEDVTDLARYLPGREGGRGAEAARYRELIDAAQYATRNHQDEAAYARVVRLMAGGVKPDAWDAKTQKLVADYRRYGRRELLGRSAAMTTLQERIAKVAKHAEARVLIVGESGTGKETVAQLIHAKSPRRDEPYVAFNCASVNAELLESRFFGHEKGAFTGADRQTDGLFLMAHGGTLFLDEIGELLPEAQALLLRVLETGRFMRVGGREEIEVDVRLVTATNRNLAQRVREGKFRADLYQRLNVVQLRTPPLREHKEDIALIANAWWRKHHGNRTLGAGQLAALAGYGYPGNVRELINILDRATALEEDDFDLLIREQREMNAALETLDGAAAAAAADDGAEDLETVTRRHVRRVFERCGGNMAEASRRLAVSRNTVKKYLEG